MDDLEQQFLLFVMSLEQEVIDLEYGTIVVNVIVVDGVPRLDTLNMVKSKRKRYLTVKDD